VLKRHLYQTVQAEELTNSFLNMLPNRECEMIKLYAREERASLKQPIADILSESRVYANPTKANIMELCARAAEVTLVRLPFVGMQSLVNGMGGFWKKITPDMFDALFSAIKPTPEKVIDSLDVNEICSQDGKITTFLHRYIRSCSQSELETLIRFITGTTCLPPNTVIKVQFISTTHAYLYPQSSTCFKILNLPKNYSSFAQFRENFRAYLSDESLWIIHDPETDDSVSANL